MRAPKTYLKCRICGLPTSYVVGRANTPHTAKHKTCLPNHGESARYDAGCRCGDCRKAVSADFAAYRKRREASPAPHQVCTESGCVRASAARNLCRMHYRIARKAEGTWRPSPSDAWDTPSRLAKYKARKAVLRGAQGPAEKFTVAELIKISGATCGICHAEIDVELSYPDPRSASVDHIVPVSLGGRHVLSNARPAHLRCNIARGNRSLT